MNQNHNSPARGRFEDKGFYIILFLCIAAVGIAGYVLFSEPKTNDDTLQGYEYSSDESVTTGQADESVEIPEQTAAQTEEPKDASDSAQEDAPEEHSEATAGGTDEEDAETAAPASAVRPVEGKVLRGYSDSELTYDETMEDWRAHIGTDYAATAGESVKAMLGGKVSAVTQDNLYGGCVRVTDGDTEILYAGLDKIAVSEGDTISAGDVLGTAAKTLPAESALQTHIHVEMRQAGSTADPETLFIH